MSFLQGIAFLIASFFIAFEGVFYSTLVDRVYELIFFIFIFKSLIKEYRINKVIELTIKLLMIFSLFILLRMFMIFIISSELELYIINDLIRVFFILFYFYIIYYMLNQNFKILYLIFFMNFIIMLIAFFQADITPLTNEAWQLKYSYLGGTDNSTFRKRVVGLYGSATPVAYILATNMTLTLYLYLKRNNIIFVLYFFLLGMIAVFTQTRSVLLTWLLLFLYLVFISVSKGTFFKRTMTLFIISCSFYFGGNFYYNNIDSADNFNRVTNFDDNSAQGRGPLMLAGLYTILEYPFGHTNKEYFEKKNEIYLLSDNIDVLKFPSHNGLINIGFKYTIFGLLIFFIYLLLLRNIIHKNISMKYKSFFTIAFLAYSLNGAFHNNFVFVEDFYALLMLAIIAYEYKKSQEEYPNEM